MAILIEFAGLSGSGKTVLSRKIVQYLKKRGLTVISRDTTLIYNYFRKKPPAYKGIKWLMLKCLFLNTPYLLGKSFVNIFYNYSLMDLVCRFEVRHPDLTAMVHDGLEHNYYAEQGKISALKMVYEAFSIYQIIDELNNLPGSDNIIVLDEGLCRVGRIIYARGDVQPVEKATVFADRIPLPSLIVHVDTEPSVCIARAVDMPDGGYFGKGKEISDFQMQTLENGRLCIAMMCERLKNRNVPVFKVTNNDDLDSAIQLIQKYLDNFFRNVAKE